MREGPEFFTRLHSNVPLFFHPCLLYLPILLLFRSNQLLTTIVIFSFSPFFNSLLFHSFHKITFYKCLSSLKFVCTVGLNFFLLDFSLQNFQVSHIIICKKVWYIALCLCSIYILSNWDGIFEQYCIFMYYSQLFNNIKIIPNNWIQIVFC